MKEITQINCPPATAVYFKELKSRGLQKEYSRENSRTLKIKIDSGDDSMTYFKQENHSKKIFTEKIDLVSRRSASKVNQVTGLIKQNLEQK